MELFCYLERQTDGKVEGIVATELWMNNRIVLVTLLVGGIDGFHAQVETQDEEIEVETKSQAVTDGQLAGQVLETELSARLFVIFAQRPDVTGIDEEGSAELPEQLGAVLHVEVELHVARLVDEVDGSIALLVFARSQRTHAPAAHTIGTA